MRFPHICIAALALSAVRGGTPPPPPVLVTSGPFLRCPWGISESLDVDGEPWWQSALTDDPSRVAPTWYEHFIQRRETVLRPQRAWEPDGFHPHTPSTKHYSRLRDDCL